MKQLRDVNLHSYPLHPSSPYAILIMTDILRKTAGLIYNVRYVLPACALAIYVIVGLAYFFAYKYWPTLPLSTQSAILENLLLAATAPF